MPDQQESWRSDSEFDTRPKPPPHPPAQRNRMPINRENWLKWTLGCSGLGMLICTGLVMVTVIVLPMAFRGLLPEQQAALIRKLPFMAGFKPTEPFAILPTFGPTSASALALLSTPVSSPTPAPSVQSLASGSDNGTPTVNPTVPGNKPPTSVLATDTPVAPDVTIVPTTAPTLIPAPTLVPPPTSIPVPISFHSNGFTWVPQKWNNCGPANLTQTLTYYGWSGNQDQAAAYLKPNREDKNVSPEQMVDFVNRQTPFKALMRYAGDFDLIKRLVSNQFAVLLETGYVVAGEGWMGHYLTVIGYDDTQRVFYGLDTYLGDDKDALGIRETYDDLDQRWQQFDRVYIVVYTKERESELAALLGSQADPRSNWQHSLDVAVVEAKAQPTNQYAWFNLGTSHTLLGQYKKAATAFDQAWSVGGGLPFRFLWYQFRPYEAYYNMGNFTNVMALASTTMQTTKYVEETFYWRGMAEAAQDKLDAAKQDFQQALRFNPNFTPAADRLSQVLSGNFVPPAVAQAGQ